jgi:predicted deacetylase
MTERGDEAASAAQPRCNNAAEPALLVALHDVTPAHAERLERAERLLTALGIPAVAYLFVPDFHGRGPAHDDADFVAWCRQPRPYVVQWVLHGYAHREDPRDRRGATPTLTDRFARSFLTDGEGEFLSLRGSRLCERLRAGVASLTSAVGRRPEGFVAPAWLFNDDLIPCLKRLGVPFTESHFHVFDLRNDRPHAAPVITWASRSAARRTTSVVTAAVERRLWARRPLLRVALHPGDFDHQRIVDSVASTLGALLASRRAVTYEEWCAPAEPGR